MAATNIARAQDDEFRKHLLHALGGPFIVYRTNIQAELKLSDNQKQKLLANLPAYLQTTTKVFEKFRNLDQGEGEKEMQSVRPTSYKKLWQLLGENLRPEQLQRFQQLELQHEGPAALLSRPEIVKQLDITNEQRQQFMGIVQEMQRKMAPLMQEAHSGGNQYEIRQQAIKLYAEQERKVEAALTESQRNRWLSMYGAPFDVFNDN